MTPENLIRELQSVPYLQGGSSWAGGDCWFVVEKWFEELWGIKLEDRGSISPGPEGIAEGFVNKADWEVVEEPMDDDVVIMRSVVNRQPIISGHCGVFWKNGVIHSEKASGCVYLSKDSRQIKSRITSYLRHRKLIH